MNTMSFIKLKNAVGNEAYRTSKTLYVTDIDCNEIKNAIYKESNNAKISKCDTGFLIDYIIKTHHAFAKNNALLFIILRKKLHTATVTNITS